MTQLPVTKNADNSEITVDLGKLTKELNNRKIIILARSTNGKANLSQIRYSADSHGSLKRLLELLKDKHHISAEYLLPDDMSAEFSMINKKEQEFELFSNKAKEIRNNDYDIDDFIDFKNNLSKFKRPLKPLQLLNAYHLSFAKNACNFSVPGAGKTSTVIGGYQHMKATNYVTKIVVICPLSAFMAWRNEYKECYGHLPTYVELSGENAKPIGQLENETLGLNSKYEMLLVSYQSVAKYQNLLKDFMKLNDTMLVVDEAHRIKRLEGGLWADTILALAPLAKSRAALTGTPAPNSYVDLVNLFKFIWPDKYVLKYSPAQLKWMSEPDYPYPDNVKLLNAYASPFYIRITKKDLNLPEITQNPSVEVEMDAEHEAIYRDLENHYNLKKYANSNESGGLDVFAMIIRLRQAASDPILLLKGIDAMDDESFSKDLQDAVNNSAIPESMIKRAKEYSRHTYSRKYKIILEQIEEIINKGGRAIVWCEFITTIDRLNEYLNKNGIASKILYGGTPNSEREQIITEFQSNPDAAFKVILANPQAVGESISIHNYCHNAIYFELGYNAATFMQSKDRIHRLGLPENTVTTYDFYVTKNTIDQSIVDKVLAKEQRMIKLLESDQIPLIKENSDYLTDGSDELKTILKEYSESHSME